MILNEKKTHFFRAEGKIDFLKCFDFGVPCSEKLLFSPDAVDVFKADLSIFQ